MLDIIINNPYRILGVFSNSPKREIVANVAKIKAFSKVGRDVGFITDFDKILYPIERNEQNVIHAETCLALTDDCIRYAQFWFLKINAIDEIAFNHLAAGDIDKALGIWAKKENESSLQNSIVCLLIKKDYKKAIQLAQTLYGLYNQEFQEAVLGETRKVPKGALFNNFISELKSELSYFDIIDEINISSEKEALARSLIRPLEGHINDLISRSKKGDKSIGNAKQLAHDCSPYLGDIYSLSRNLSDGEMLSRRISTKIGEQMLSMIIDDVNKAISDFENSSSSFSRMFGRTNISNKFKEGLNAISIIRELSLETAFANGRLKEQENVLKKLYGEVSSSSLRISDYDDILFSEELDLRDSRTFYANCKSASDYKQYCKRYPFAFNYEEALDLYESLSFKSCKSEADYREYIKSFPNGKHVREVKRLLEEILFNQCDTIKKCEEYLKLFPSEYRSYIIKNKLKEYQEEEIRKAQERVRQKNKSDSFNNTKTLIDYFNSNKKECSLIDIWASRALQLAKTKKEFLLVALNFKDTTSGRDAQKKYDRLKEESKEKQMKWLKWLGIPFGSLCLILLIGLICGNFLGVASIVVYGFSILVGIAAFFGLIALTSDADLPGCFGYLFLGLAVACAAPLWIAGDAINEYKESIKEKSELFDNPTLEKCETYIKNNPSDSDKDKILSIWLPLLLNECTKEPSLSANGYNYNREKPLDRLKSFADNYTSTTHGRIASERFNTICDSLYNIALSVNTSEGWENYKKWVPESEYRDANDRLEAIRNLEWSTDSRAWNTATNLDNQIAYETYLEKYPRGQHRIQADQKVAEFKYGIEWSTESKAWQAATSQGTISGFERYLELYPSGAHANAANRKIVEINVQRAEANGTALPKMDQVGYGYGSTSNVSVTNSTSYTMTLKYYGPSERTLTILPNSTRSISLPNGSYSISASVAGGGVRSYYGSENFSGGSYSVEYYIVTSRY